ncbi:MAG: FxDxF family PEP-CTERM protein [Thermomicrobiales bacterium]
MKISGLALAGALAAAPVAANAATYINFSNKTGTFGNTLVKKFGFVDNFTFVTPAAGRVWVTISSMFTIAGTNLDFNNSSNVNLTPFVNVSSGVTEYRALLNLPVNAGTQSIRVAGFAQGDASYTGTIAFAVPEPATWALLILGFGGIAYSMRRRKQDVKVSFA